MRAVLTFSGVVLTLYIYLSVTGYKCAAESGRMVEKAIGRKIGSSPSLLQLLALPFVLWLNGLVAMIRGKERHIAKGAEIYLDEAGWSGTDKRRIREAVRDYRKKYSLF